MQVGIVGAGVTGLAAAHRLVTHGHRVVVVESGRGVGGRLATRRTHGCLIDHGAQYLKLPDDHPEVERLVRGDLSTEGLLDIRRPVWTFDRGGCVQPGDAEQNAEPKWTYSDGLNTLAGRLAHDLDVRLNQRIASIGRSSSGYALLDDAGNVLAEGDRVLVTCPAPRALKLLQDAGIESETPPAALAELQKVRYRQILSVTLGYPMPETVFRGGTPHDPRPYYALVNTDRGHPISWLACENDKGPKRVPPNVLALVVQMSGSWSADHAGDVPENVALLAAHAASDLLGVDLRRPAWYDVAHWRNALPDALCDLSQLNRGRQGLLFAGDYVAGGRIHLALQAGMDVASIIMNG